MKFVSVFLLAGLLGVAAAQGAALAVNAPAFAVEAADNAEDMTLLKSPMVEITKSCPRLRYIGRDATFEITVTNKGDGAATNVVVTDALNGGFEFLSADNNGAREGNNIVWRVGTLDAGQTRTLKVNARCTQIGVIKNMATVTYCAEANAGCETEVKGIPAILLECVDDPDPIEVGAQLTYTIVVTNQGSQTGTNIVIECTLPDEQEFVKAGGAAAATNAGKEVKFAPLATLAPKAKATYTVTVKGIKPADSRFRVLLKSDQIETPVMETESTHIYD